MSNTGLHSSPFFGHFANQARGIIARAEADLGPLDAPQRRDLLADNTGWTLETIREMVAYLGAEAAIIEMDPYCSKCGDHHRVGRCPAMV